MDAPKPNVSPAGGIRTMQSDKKQVLNDTGVSFSDSPKADVPAPASEPESHVAVSTGGDGAVFDVSSAFKGEAELGTFVTDKKKKHRGFFGIMRSAAKEWTEDKTETVKNLEVFQKPEVPTIAPGTKRKEIIQKAITNTDQLPHDDHQVVIERIKTFQSDAERVTGKPYLIKPKEERSKKSGWSHIIDDKGGNGNVPATAPHIVEEHIKRPSINREEITPETKDRGAAPAVETRIDATMDSYLKKEAAEDTVNRAFVAPGSVAADILPATDKRTTLPEYAHKEEKPSTPSVAEIAPQVPQIVPQKEVEPELPVAKDVTTLPKTPALILAEPASSETPGRNPAKRLVYVGVFMLIVSILGSGTAFLLFGTRLNETPVVIAEPIKPAFTSIEVVVTKPLPATRETLLSEISTTIESHSSSVVLAYETSDVPSTLASTEAFLSVLDPRMQGAFMRSLEPTFVLGGIKAVSNEPFLIFKSESFDSTFAGMLEWETFMSADLAPLYGSPVQRSANPDARTVDGTTEAAFVDRIVSNRNVRVLYDEMGDSRILYGFTDPETLIITTNEAAFIALLERL